MTTHNLALYRILVKAGASEADAQDAATFDASSLVTKSDLTAAVAELKADLTKTILTALVAMTAIFAGISAALRYVK